MKLIKQSPSALAIQILLFLGIQVFTGTNTLSAASLSDKWMSTANPKCQGWFQNWGNYQRLLLIIDTDTTEVLPSPYVTEKKGKPYLKPKPYKKVKKQQLKGNLNWVEEPSWSDGVKNIASWEVDRANPKITLPQSFNVDFTLINDEMIMKIKQGDELYLEAQLKSITSYK